MNTGPLIAEIAALVSDPARATMLTALLDGRALTASELAYAARITPQTASTQGNARAIAVRIGEGRGGIVRVTGAVAGLSNGTAGTGDSERCRRRNSFSIR